MPVELDGPRTVAMHVRRQDESLYVAHLTNATTDCSIPIEQVMETLLPAG